MCIPILRPMKQSATYTNKLLTVLTEGRDFLFYSSHILFIFLHTSGLSPPPNTVSAKNRETGSVIIVKLPDQIKQGISRRHHWPSWGFMSLFFSAGSRMNDQYQNDPHNYSNEGSPQVICDGKKAQASTGLGVHSRQARH